jgi:hypothetical protein
VTAARTDEPQMTTVRQQKDPKKQAAGKAGAAARKAKQERLLAELRDAKAVMQQDTEGATASISASIATQQPKASTAHHNDSSWIPWVMGAAGLTGLAWIVASTQCRNGSAPKEQQQQAKLSPPVKQLKATADPFYMD